MIFMHGMKKICFTCSHGKTNMTNNTIKIIQSLERGKYRKEHSQFFIEGGDGAGKSKSLIIVLYEYGIIGHTIHPLLFIKFFT